MTDEELLNAVNPHDPTVTPTEKLDALLIWLSENKNESNCGIRMPIHYKKTKNILLTEWERDRILEKLHKDEYIDMYQQTPSGASGNLPHYRINFNGEVFLQNNGYTQEKINNDREINLRKSDEKIRKRNEAVLASGSIWVAVGTILLFLWEVGKAIVSLFHHHHC